LSGRPFTIGEAGDLGVTPRQLAGASFVGAFRGVHARADEHDPGSLQQRATAVLVGLPRQAVISHATAAQLYGLPVRPDPRIHVTVPSKAVVPVLRAGLRPHEGVGADDARQLACGLRLTTPARTWLDLAPDVGRDGLVVLGDAMLRQGLVTVDELRAAAGAAARRRGVVAARSAAQLVRPGVDSPQETTLRLLIRAAGLPEPEVNLDVVDAAGYWVARPDLSYPAWRIAIEYEGDHHRADRTQWRRDIQRDRDLERLGWVVIRVVPDDLRGSSEGLLRRLRAAVRERRTS
jgi:very-short-patch-repair endonuclease